MFRTTGVVNKDFINEIKRYLIPVYVKVAYALAPLCFLPVFPFGSIGLILGDILVLYIMYAALVFLYFVRRSKLVKLQLDRIFESTGTYEMEYTVSFEEDGIVVENHSTGANSKVKYDSMRRLVKCNSFYVLFTKSRQYFPIFTDCLNGEEKEELVDFLKRHVPSLKY